MQHVTCRVWTYYHVSRFKHLIRRVNFSQRENIIRISTSAQRRPTSELGKDVTDGDRQLFHKRATAIGNVLAIWSHGERRWSERKNVAPHCHVSISFSDLKVNIQGCCIMCAGITSVSCSCLEATLTSCHCVSVARRLFTIWKTWHFQIFGLAIEIMLWPRKCVCTVYTVTGLYSALSTHL